MLAGLHAEEIARLVYSAAGAPLVALEQDIIRLILEDMRRTGEVLTGEVYRDGLSQVLTEPEFSEMEVARNALRILEERPLLEDLLSRTMLNSEMGGVQALIGGEGTWQEPARLLDCPGPLRRARPGDRNAGCARPDPHALWENHFCRPLCGWLAQRPGHRLAR